MWLLREGDRIRERIIHGDFLTLEQPVFEVNTGRVLTAVDTKDWSHHRSSEELRPACPRIVPLKDRAAEGGGHSLTACSSFPKVPTLRH